MEPISLYRGAAGEVVRGFLRPATLLTVVPVFACLLFLGVLAGLIIGALELPLVFALPLAVTFSSPVVGLFAMSARTGTLNVGFFEALVGDRGASVGGFILRHAILSVAWGVPVGALAPELGRAGASALVAGPSSAEAV